MGRKKAEIDIPRKVDGETQIANYMLGSCVGNGMEGIQYRDVGDTFIRKNAIKIPN